MVVKRRWVAIAVVVVAAPLWAAAAPAAQATGVIDPPPPGLPAFYGVPDPLPAGHPGDVVKTEQVQTPGLDGTMYRVMYHSVSLLGSDIVVTGLIAVPKTPPPADGYPVISWAHGTTGIADICAPSLDPSGAIVLANVLLDRGYLVVATDYEGLGTPGRHPYIVGVSEARGVLDIVRAARNLSDLHASRNYVVWGHSQGGHAAMYALHIADKWAPELHLAGVVAGAPPSQLLLIEQALQHTPFKFYILMAAAGFNAAYGDQQAPLDQVLTPAGLQALNLVDQYCAGALGAALAGVDFSTLQKADPASVPAWADLLSQNDPGQFTQAAREPLLIIQGGFDEQIPVISTLLLFNQLCAIGQTEQRWLYPGLSHAGVVPVSINDMLGWIADRFDGQPAPDPIAPVGEPGVQTSQCAAPSAPPPPPPVPTTSTTSVVPATTTTSPSSTTTTTALAAAGQGGGGSATVSGVTVSRTSQTLPFTGSSRTTIVLVALALLLLDLGCLAVTAARPARRSDKRSRDG